MSSSSADSRLLCRISPTVISLDEAIRFVASPTSGGIASFVGTARIGSTTTASAEVVRLEYEAYQSMAAEMLHVIAGEVLQAHAVDRIALLHRTGVVEIGEAAIVAAVSARHRAAAFDGCRMAVEQVKARLPIWKKELFVDGSQWVGSGA